MAENSAAVLPAARADLEVRPAPLWSPGPGEVLVRVDALAVNPLDVIKQASGDLMYRWLSYPAVLGEDVAVVVAATAGGASRFRPGQRVLAYALGMEKGSDHRAEGGFQHHVVVREALCAVVPDHLALTDVVVLPLAVSTAAAGLFGAGQLALRPPSTAPAGGAGGADGPGGVRDADSRGAGGVVVVWGAATSVGLCAVQLATAAGYRVVAAASPRSQALVRDLGAVDVVDRSDPQAVAQVAAAVARAGAGRPAAGVLAVGVGSGGPGLSIAVRTRSPRLALTSPSVDLAALREATVLRRAQAVGLLGAGTGALLARAVLHRVRTRFVWGASVAADGVGPLLWRDFLPGALADGSFVPAPAARVVGSGLASLQPALDELRAGVSAAKLVVTV